MQLATTPCLVCGEARSRRVARLVHAEVRACEGCGLVVCDPLPTVASASAGASSVLTEEAFTQSILEVSPERAARYRELARARHARWSKDLGRPPGRVLEIGCGAAGLAEELGRLGVAYHGLDLDPRPVEAARARGVPNLRIGDFLSLPDEAPYDVICLSQVLEHITRPRALVAQLARWLVPGGLVHVDVPHHGALAGLPTRLAGAALERAGRVLPGSRCGGVAWPHHALAYTPRALAALFAADFDVETFTATPDDAVWGQPTVPGRSARVYYAAQRVLPARSLAVAYGRRR